MYDFGLIGNGQTLALINKIGSLEWLCWPRPDSPPVFGKLLDPDGGALTIEGANVQNTSQFYRPNTNILVTRVSGPDGTYEITDFCPRFEQHGRIYRPNAVFRIVAPIDGNPQIRVNCQPVNGWSKHPVTGQPGNSHIRYELEGGYMRLLTTMSLTHLSQGTTFPLTEKIYFGLTWGHAIEDDLARVANDFLESTHRYWRTWVQHCSIPSEFQKETIRSALTLKMHCFDDTGAILAASTTSLPEEKQGVRNWDYRFCWLRDSYFVLSALYKLGHFEEMEGFLKFLLGVAYREDNLRPVYAIDGGIPLPEHLHANWKGFAGSTPVRSNNEAASHVQNDVYGELILTLAPLYMDERFQHLRIQDHESLIVHLAERCYSTLAVPDAGLWELRGGWQVHSFTDLMCWAGLQQVYRLCQMGFLPKLHDKIKPWLDQAVTAVRQSVKEGSLRNGPTDPSFNAANLQMAVLKFPDEELVKATVKATAENLQIEKDSPFLYRYRFHDDFGTPQSAFVVCSLWWAQALGAIGMAREGKDVLRRTLESANSLGLFSEHFQRSHKEQLGNFPQAYSHVGLINAAFAVSPPWSDLMV